MIKPLLLTAAIVAPVLHANEAAIKCEPVGKYAERYYDMRQGDTPADVAFKEAISNEVTMQIAREAYTMPRWSTEKYRNNNRVDFKSKWVLWCYDTFDGGK